MPIPKFLKKNGSTILVLAFVLLLLIPQTGMPIKVFFSRLLSFSPSEITVDKRESLEQYNWQLANPEGQPVNLAVSEGKVVLINFWATWCPPCVAEMPSLQNLYNEYGDRVDFYFVSMESPEKITAFMKKKDYDFPVYIPKQQIPEVIRGNTLPTTYIIGSSGEIVVDKKGAAKWDSDKTKELLDGLLSNQESGSANFPKGD
jgi:thiol-disulfide isomerase/thioredoxin